MTAKIDNERSTIRRSRVVKWLICKIRNRILSAKECARVNDLQGGRVDLAVAAELAEMAERVAYGRDP